MLYRSYVLPLPPTSNNLYRVVNGHITKTKVAREYESLVAGWVDLIDIAGGPTPKLSISLSFYLVRDRDVDNVKPLIDALTRAMGIDDKYVVRLMIDKHKIGKNSQGGPRVEIEIREHLTCPDCFLGQHG